MNAKDRYLTRRAAFLLGLPILAGAERKYLRDAPVKYYFPPDYAPTAQERTIIRRLARENGRCIAGWPDSGVRVDRRDSLAFTGARRILEANSKGDTP